MVGEIRIGEEDWDTLADLDARRRDHTREQARGEGAHGSAARRRSGNGSTATTEPALPGRTALRLTGRRPLPGESRYPGTRPRPLGVS
ncbi:hypothetical protein ABT063_47565 [Streptomyces sp. NPDC002838]|uniref:hypothetical protein n=1 Tax=Streptomyces sp. NPDC002838 TaxID=3154436 RepID=UPI003320C0AC